MMILPMTRSLIVWLSVVREAVWVKVKVPRSPRTTSALSYCPVALQRIEAFDRFKFIMPLIRVQLLRYLLRVQGKARNTKAHSLMPPRIVHNPTSSYWPTTWR